MSSTTDEAGGNFPERVAPEVETATDASGTERIVTQKEDNWEPAPVTPADLGVEDDAEDDAPEPTKAELQDELREAGLPVSGTKPELIERLEEEG